MNKRYYSLEVKDTEADIFIFGDITSWEWFESDVSSYTLSKELQELGEEIEKINVHINSYGGEVAEGLAIYNMLRNHKAKVVTVCDGFACSIASVIFMAGDERIMNNASLLMIHNAWIITAGNADQLRKEADDLETITQASIEAYKSVVSIEEDEIKELLDAESWLLPEDALEKGFATSIVNVADSNKAAANAKKTMFKLMTDSLIFDSIHYKKEKSESFKELQESETVMDMEEMAELVVKKIKEELAEEEPPEETNDDEPNQEEDLETEPENKDESNKVPEENKLARMMLAILKNERR